ncbi:hypothetical protein G4B88_024930 [Cannabis sativa]|uniref:Uncharacterized protein n=1 Tax=Cannabis sativa TaxID=3483 RepID=A0A7J6G9K6_CANSA|nr:hypothetical protein G4B88_024930 [Cannabis sativa]
MDRNSPAPSLPFYHYRPLTSSRLSFRGWSSSSSRFQNPSTGSSGCCNMRLFFRSLMTRPGLTPTESWAAPLSDSKITGGFCYCLVSILDGAAPEEVLTMKRFGGFERGVAWWAAVEYLA